MKHNLETCDWKYKEIDRMRKKASVIDTDFSSTNFEVEEQLDIVDLIHKEPNFSNEQYTKGSVVYKGKKILWELILYARLGQKTIIVSNSDTR